jgi:hypothetical protein
MAGKLTEFRCLLWRAAGKSAMLLVVPFYAIDASVTWLAEAFAHLMTLLCAIAAMPLVIFYDWCVKRHNALREEDKP